jgi:glycine/sarcosine N-methyltransferase
MIMAEHINAAADFYRAMAPVFDVMTNWEERLAGEGPFLRAVLSGAGAKQVLDAACGSGGHTLALASWGYHAAGADISDGMVDLARAKALRAGLEVPFTVAGLAGLAEHFPPASFDAVLCLGNSLPHLLTQADLVQGLQGMAHVLRPGGVVVTQALNYDLRWRTQPRFFGVQSGMQEGKQVLVWRFADYDVAAERILFHVALFSQSPDGWSVEVQTTPQRPIWQRDMLAALASAGFERASSYGSMTWPAPPFDAYGSGDLVMVATRGEVRDLQG